MGYNKFIGMGRLTRDAELKTTGTGISVISFNVAIDRDIKTQDGRNVDFVNCVAWRKTAEFVERYFKKGDMIHIEGSLQSREYTDKNDAKWTVWEIQVDKVTFCGSKSSEPTEQQRANLDGLKSKAGLDVADDSEDLPF